MEPTKGPVFLRLTRISPESSDAARSIALGPWCCPEALVPVDAPEEVRDQGQQILPYHWATVQEVSEDLSYLNPLTERIMRQLTQKLNSVHGTRHDLRYWNIVIGWWVRTYVQIYWDRWQTLAQARAALPSAIVRCSGQSHSIEPFLSMRDFIDRVYGDQWNENFYHYLATTYFDFGHIEIEAACAKFNLAPSVASNSGSLRGRSRFRGYVRRLAFRIRQSFPSRRLRVALYATYLRGIHEVLVALLLKQFPQDSSLDFTSDFSRNSPNDCDRSWSLELQGSDFERALSQDLPQALPRTVLEDYNSLVTAVQRRRWPKAPSVLATGIGHYSSDLYQRWAAEQVSLGAKLVILQHGGTYGVAMDHAASDHDQAVADSIFTWGWNAHKAKKAPAIKLASKGKAQYESNGFLTLVLTDLPPYTGHVTSSTLPTNQYLVFRDIGHAIQQLPLEIRGRIKFRVMPSVNGFGGEEHLMSLAPDAIPTDWSETFEQGIRSSRLVVCTDNSTTMIESMKLGYPTLIYLRDDQHLFSGLATPYITELEDAGVLHKEVSTLIAQIQAIWASPMEWWLQEQTIRSVHSFMNTFGWTGPHPRSTLAQMLKAEML